MDVATIHIDLSDDGSLSTVTVAGSVTINNSEELRRTLAEQLNQPAKVTLDLTGVEQVDITAAQVICSACKTAAALERSFVIAGKPPACITGFGQNIGAQQGVPCSQNRNQPCNWFGGTYEWKK